MIAVVDYGMGNVGSMLNMIEKAGGAAAAARTPADLARADKVVLPGVGAFDNGVRGLKERGLWDALVSKAMDEKVPVLGVCLGLQLFCKASEEGALPGFGWLPARVERFRFADADAGLKVPHMGWNTVDGAAGAALFRDMAPDASFYFVHSYRMTPEDPSIVEGTTAYGGPFPSLARRGNVFATQFHPEKSRRHGLQLMRNFVAL